jgi:hypothetical protein
MLILVGDDIIIQPQRGEIPVVRNNLPLLESRPVGAFV